MMSQFSPHDHSRTGGFGLRRGCCRFAAALTAIGWFFAGPALAGLIEVEILLPDGRPYAKVLTFLHPPVDPHLDLTTRQWRRETHQGWTDTQGMMGFIGVSPGRYTFSLPVPTGVIQPAENPAQPAPILTLFGEEKLRGLIQLQYGTPVEVAVALPSLPAETVLGDYTVHYQHRKTGFELISKLRAPLLRVTRLLSEGTWDVWVDAPAGQLLVGLQHEGSALPGDSAPLVFPVPKSPPLATHVTFTYTTTAAIEGQVVVTGGAAPTLEIVASLARPGDWLASVNERGGSSYSSVVAALGRDGYYHIDLPDGVWRVAPHSQRIVSAEPASILVEAKPGEVALANFEVELDPALAGTFRVRVQAPDGGDLAGAVVQLTSLEDPATVLRSGETRWHGTSQHAFVDLANVGEGHYLLLAGHPDYLEARRELPSFESGETGQILIELEAGADFYLQAIDLDDAPARGVEWTIEHLHPPLDLKLQDPTFVESKKKRVAVTDDSGRVRVPGFYAGSYRLRAVRPPGGDPLLEDESGVAIDLGGLFHVGQTVGELAPTVEVHLSARDSARAWARQLPGASLLFQLFCDDSEPLPPEVAYVVVDLDGPTRDMEAAKKAALIQGEGVQLFGPRRDSLLIGPLDQGVFRVAIRPATFTRWTWAFGAHDGAESYPIQIDIEENQPMALVHQGPFKVECAPAVDLVPEISGATLPDLRRVDVQADILDLHEDRVIAASPKIERLVDRAELRGFSSGRARLDFVLSHPHFLPETDLRWQVDLDLQRGQYRPVRPEIPALGGALQIEKLSQGLFVRVEGLFVRVEGEGIEPLEVSVENEPVLVPSLVPGTYSVLLCAATQCAEPLERWHAVEVRQGVTTILD